MPRTSKWRTWSLTDRFMGQAVAERSRLFTTTASGESTDDRVAGILKEALVDINRARVELMLDAEGQEVLDVFQNVVFDAFTDFSQAWAARAESPASVTAGELAGHRERLQEGLKALVQSARSHLAQLEQVIPLARPASTAPK
jgi:ribosomal protein L12E/L44/L45/RPP1/RPP2